MFAFLPPAVTKALQEEYPFYESGTWPTGVVRWMASFDTTEEDVDAFIELISEVMGELG